MSKSKLLLNDVPVFHENLLRFGLVRLEVVTKHFFRLLCFVTQSICSVGELNFSQDFMNERRGIAFVTDSLFKASFVFIKILLN